MMVVDVGTMPCLQPRAMLDPVWGLQEGQSGSTQQGGCNAAGADDVEGAVETVLSLGVGLVVLILDSLP